MNAAAKGRVTTQDIVSKLWGLCHVLRDDGVTYQDYVTELTFLLFLKMMEETKRRLSEHIIWADTHGALAGTNSFLRDLDESQWLHFGEWPA